MKTLIISDIHHRIVRAQKLIDAHPCDRYVFLGDIYDDFGDDVLIAGKTARWHKEKLADEKNTFIWGNHDLPYAYWHNKDLKCSGNTRDKAEVINDIMERQDWAKIKFFVQVDGWLISHAGLRPDFGDKDLEAEASAAIKCADAIQPHWMIAAGYARGGGWALGGLTWLDWNQEFKPIPGIKQIVGHTPGKMPREKDGNWCIDTHMRHAAIIEDGKLEIFAI